MTMPNPSAGASERVRAALDTECGFRHADVRALLDERDRLAAEVGQLRADRDFDRDAALRDAAALREQVEALQCQMSDLGAERLKDASHAAALRGALESLRVERDMLFNHWVSRTGNDELVAFYRAARARAERGELATEENDAG